MANGKFGNFNTRLVRRVYLQIQTLDVQTTIEALYVRKPHPV